ncbi:hypothetical protein FJZ31_19325 [Candidatus Poribacteria bacterium]|nr:hypothetical protein [Candidatus Poribacteria bacterium]
MSKNNNLPPKILELLKKKGWNWPPDEKLKAQIREASERFTMHIDEEVLLEVLKDFPGFESRYGYRKT